MSELTRTMYLTRFSNYCYSIKIKREMYVTDLLYSMNVECTSSLSIGHCIGFANFFFNQ